VRRALLLHGRAKPNANAQRKRTSPATLEELDGGKRISSSPQSPGKINGFRFKILKKNAKNARDRRTGKNRRGKKGTTGSCTAIYGSKEETPYAPVNMGVQPKEKKSLVSRFGEGSPLRWRRGRVARELGRNYEQLRAELDVSRMGAAVIVEEPSGEKKP